MSQKVVDAAMALLEAARDSAVADAIVSPDGERLMAMARKLCERAGHDPDEVVMGLPDQAPTTGAKGLPTVYLPMGPAWYLYWDEAVRALALVRETEPETEPEKESEKETVDEGQKSAA